MARASDSESSSQPYRLPGRGRALPVVQQPNDCVTALRALGEETRVRIVALLMEQPMDVGAISDALERLSLQRLQAPARAARGRPARGREGRAPAPLCAARGDQARGRGRARPRPGLLQLPVRRQRRRTAGREGRPRTAQNGRRAGNSVRPAARPPPARAAAAGGRRHRPPARTAPASRAPACTTGQLAPLAKISGPIADARTVSICAAPWIRAQVSRPERVAPDREEEDRDHPSGQPSRAAKIHSCDRVARSGSAPSAARIDEHRDAPAAAASASAASASRTPTGRPAR